MYVCKGQRIEAVGISKVVSKGREIENPLLVTQICLKRVSLLE